MSHSSSEEAGRILRTIYETLLSYYSPQHWWPASSGSAWEIMVGAILTQRTTWRNVALALDNLINALGKEALSEPQVLLSAPEDDLAALIRPAGYHTSKPRKLKNLASFVVDYGGLDALVNSPEDTWTLRSKLLGIWGIGPETADAILLYACKRPVFVADAYALRLASRWGLVGPGASYNTIQALFMDNLPQDSQLFNEYHALIVAHGKTICRPRPACPICPLNTHLSLRGGSGTWRCPRLGVLPVGVVETR